MNNFDTAARAISELKNPFENQYISSIRIYSAKSLDWEYHGTIEFKNGDTGGEQRLKAPDLKTLLLRMDNFIQELGATHE